MFIFICILALFVIAGCGSTSTTSPAGGGAVSTPSYSANIQTIFDANCTTSSCHGSAASGGLTLTPAATAYNELLGLQGAGSSNGPVVVSGNASGSTLVKKLEGTAGFGVQMPKGANPLSSDTIQTIKNWINQGAQNN